MVPRQESESYASNGLPNSDRLPVAPHTMRANKPENPDSC